VNEYQLENYICEHPELLEFYRDYLPEEMCADSAKVAIIGRQVVVEHGIIDLLIHCPDNYPTIGVIELKANPIIEKDVGQLLRYMWDMKEMLRSSHDYSPSEFIDGFDEMPELRQDMFWRILGEQPPFQGILIGPSISEQVMAACEAANIEMYLYDVADDEISLTSCWLESSSCPDRSLMRELQTIRYNDAHSQIDVYIEADLNASLRTNRVRGKI